MQSVGPTASTKPAKYPTKLRRNYPRSRNGCLTCRQRKKKCDEIRPQCTACQRNELECVWPLASAPRGGAGRSQPPQPQQSPLQQEPQKHAWTAAHNDAHQNHQHGQPHPQHHLNHSAPSPQSPRLTPIRSAVPPLPPGNAPGSLQPGVSFTAVHDDDFGSAYDDDAASAVSAPRNRNSNDNGFGANWDARYGSMNNSNNNVRSSSVPMSANPPGSSPVNLQSPHSSTLNLFEHKRHWKTYLPMLAAWNGVEGSSTSLNAHSHEVPNVVLGAAASGNANANAGGGGAGGIGGGSAGAANEKSPSAEPGLDTRSVASVETARYGSSSEAGQGGYHDGGYVDSSSSNNNNQNGNSSNGSTQRRYSNRGRAPPTDPNETEVAWVPALNAFVFPYTGPDGFPRRVTNLTPVSPVILRHYIVETGPAICSMRGRGNPFMTIILPIAYNDDLVMHCLIALAGTHMSCRMRQRSLYDNTPAAFSLAGRATASVTPFLASHMANAALHDATTRHYSCVLRNLRIALRGLDRHNTSQVLRLLLVQMLLACYEGISWNTLNGGVFAHLSASRQLIAFLRTAPQPPPTADERSLLGVLLELYTYVTLVNRMVPDGSIEGRTVVHPETTGAKVNGGASGGTSGFVGFDEDFVADPGLLARHNYFGLMLSGMHDLFALIPRVSRLAGQRYDLSHKPAAPNTLAPYDLAYIQTEVQVLRSRAQAWQLPPGCLKKAAGEQERLWWKAIGDTYRAALLIYIGTIEEGLDDSGSGGGGGSLGGDGGDIGTPGSVGGMSTMSAASSSSAAYQPHVQAIAEAVLGTDLAASRFTTIMLWPLIVTGSVLTHPEERLFLVEGLRATPQVTWGSLSAADLMEQLWVCRDGVVAGAGMRQPGTQSSSSGGDTRGGSYFGPEGLARLMRDNDISMCVF